MVHQSYEPRVIDEDVLRGNSAIVKCSIPSFVADYVNVVEWVADEESLSGFSFNRTQGNYGNSERRTAPIVPIRTPLNPHVGVNHQIINIKRTSVNLCMNNISAVNQFYESQVYDIYVIRGNAAVFKCHIPSFVSDHVQVISWHDTEEGEYTLNTNYGISTSIKIGIVQMSNPFHCIRLYISPFPNCITEYHLHCFCF